MAARSARAHREDSARARGLHPRQFAAECLRCQFAPMAARSARAHREDSARARGLHPRRFAPMAARSARAHQEANSRARGLHPRRFAPMAARSARAHQEANSRARRSASAVDSRLWQLATARAHREDSTRSRRGMVLNSLRLVFSHLSGGVWRRPAPRPLRKISPPNGGARGLLFFAAFCGVTCGD